MRSPLGIEIRLDLANALHRSIALRCVRALCLGNLLAVRASFTVQIRFQFPDSSNESMVLGFKRCLELANALYGSIALRCVRALCLGNLLAVRASFTVQIRFQFPDSSNESMVLGFKRCLELANALYGSIALRGACAIRLSDLLGGGATVAFQIRFEVPDSSHERTMLRFERCLKLANALFGNAALPRQPCFDLADSSLQLRDAAARSMPK